MANPPTYHHGNLRAALIKRAIETIAEDGVEALSLRKLSRDIGVSNAAPTRHFAGKADLLAAIAREGVEALVKTASSQAEDEYLTGVEKLRAMTEGYVGWALSNPAHHIIIRNQDVMRHADQTLLNCLNQYSDLQKQTITQAQAEGWRKNTPASIIFTQIVAFTAGLAIVATDPTYQSPMNGGPEKQTIKETIAYFYA